jgi:hypothetical protein
MAENKTPKSSYSIVRAVVSFFNLGEEGKVENFFTKQRKVLEREVASIQKRIDNYKFVHSQTMEDFTDRIEDAEAEVENAYLAIDVERLGSNEQSSAFAEDYWRKITVAEGNLDSLEEARDLAVEAHKETLKRESEQMGERKRRLVRISSKKD